MHEKKLDWLLKSRDAEIVAEDEHILIIDKPANLLVLPDRYNRSLPNLFEILNDQLGKVYVVHRIDKETSGLILFAKTADVHRNLSKQFGERSVEKKYQAISVGNVTEKNGRIELRLSEDSRNGLMKVDKKRGKEAITDYEVVEEFEGYTLLDLKPHTGRMHQIRIHLRELGVPILADPLYGDGKGLYLSSLKPRYKNEGEERPLISRTALHAQSLKFIHPATSEPVHFEATLPKDMRTALKYLRKFRAMGEGRLLQL